MRAHARDAFCKLLAQDRPRIDKWLVVHARGSHKVNEDVFVNVAAPRRGGAKLDGLACDGFEHGKIGVEYVGERQGAIVIFDERGDVGVVDTGKARGNGARERLEQLGTLVKFSLGKGCEGGGENAHVLVLLDLDGQDGVNGIGQIGRGTQIGERDVGIVAVRPAGRELDLAAIAQKANGLDAIFGHAHERHGAQGVLI